MQDRRKCRVCNEDILEGRLLALPNTTTCVKHSNVKKYIGLNASSHKSVGELIIVPQRDGEHDKEAMRQLIIGYKRKR